MSHKVNKSVFKLCRIALTYENKQCADLALISCLTRLFENEDAMLTEAREMQAR